MRERKKDTQLRDGERETQLSQLYSRYRNSTKSEVIIISTVVLLFIFNFSKQTKLLGVTIRVNISNRKPHQLSRPARFLVVSKLLLDI